MRKSIYLVMVLALFAAALAGCLRSDDRDEGVWTPQPATGALEIATRAPTAAPTLAPATRAPTAVVPTVALATVALPTAAAPTARPAPTRDPNLVIITEADVLRAVTSDATAESGATLEGVAVEFTADGGMILTASRVGYGFVSASNVELIGRLIAVDGRLEFQTESVSPRGMVTSLIPTFANQALQQYTSRWYIEEARTTEGQIELRVRP